MNIIVKIFIGTCGLAVVVTFGLWLWLYIDSTWLEKRRFAQFKYGYLKAVDDVLNHDCFIDPDTKQLKIISVAAIDGEVTSYWEHKFDEYAEHGFDVAMDTFVKHGVINKRTGEKFKYRYSELQKEKSHDKD